MLTAAGADQTATAMSPGGNMEGKEVRFGIANTALFATVTTDASCGAVNGWHDSFTPLGGLVPLANMQLSEVVFGGVGAGMYGVLVYIILSVFIAGLMVGRTPEYLGKKIQAFEVQMAMLTRAGLLAGDPGVHRRSRRCRRISARRASSIPARTGCPRCSTPIRRRAANNGSAFGGTQREHNWYNTTLGFAMLFGRFFMIIPPLAIAGSLGRKKQIPAVARHVPGHHAAVLGAAGRRDRHRRRADVLPRAQPRARSSSTS